MIENSEFFLLFFVINFLPIKFMDLKIVVSVNVLVFFWVGWCCCCLNSKSDSFCVEPVL